MIEYKQSTAQGLKFALDATGITLGDITITLCKDGGAEYTGAEAVAEIGHKLYVYFASATDTNTLGMLSLVAKVSGVQNGNPMAYQIVSHTRAEVMASIAALNNLSAAGVRTELSTELARIDASISSRLATAGYTAPTTPPTTAQIRTELATELARIDAAISSRNATTPPDSTAIQAAAAAAIAAYDPPTRAEATSDKDAVIAAIPSIPDIIGAAGGLTVETVAALEAADQILLAAPYVPDESPALIIPSPDSDESLTVVYAYTENIINAKRAGIVLTFQLVTSPAKSERILEVAAQSATTDANGYAQITLQSNLRYRVTCRELGLSKTFTPTGETLNLLTLLP